MNQFTSNQDQNDSRPILHNTHIVNYISPSKTT